VHGSLRHSAHFGSRDLAVTGPQRGQRRVQLVHAHEDGFGVVVVVVTAVVTAEWWLVKLYPPAPE